MNDSTFINPFGSITFSDIIDIFLVAALLYAFRVWTLRTNMRMEIQGIMVLGGLYIIARYLDLQMIAWVFQGFFAVFLIMLIVIFPEELRKLFRQMAVWGSRFKKTPSLRGETTNIIAGTLVDLAENKTGALIVIGGNDPLERYITGGIVLDGEISGPLLKSIFDSHSPENDGAVVVENGRIIRFGAQLPLSKDLDETDHLGTPHRAALGLAELCDAVCLVVSGERGQVSVAQNGSLAPVENLKQIASTIDHFLQERFPAREAKRTAFGLFGKHLITKAVAFLLAVFFWYVFVPGSRTVQVSYRIPVSVENLAADLRVEEIEPPVVSATFAGPRRAFYLFDARKIRVAIDVSMADLGRRTFKISEQNIRYPKELTLQELTPSTLRLSVKKVPVGEATTSP